MNEQEIFQSFGQELKQARTAQSRSLDEVASATKIHRRHLEAIESGDMAQLPQGPYIKAFLREYARVVGLKVPEAFSSPANPLHKDPRVVSRPAQAANAILDSDMLPLASVAMETARMANTAVNSAVKSVAKTTESVVKFVETGSKDALELLTSKSLWEEAEEVRRERHGLAPLPKPEKPPSEPRLREKLGASSNISGSPATATGSPNASRDKAPLSILNEYRPEPSPVTVTVEEPAEPVAAKRTNAKGTTNVVIALLILLFGGAAFFALRSSKQNSTPSGGSTQNYVPAPLDKPQPIAIPKQSQTIVTPAPINAATSSSDSLRFAVKAIEPVWVSIAADGVPAYRGEMKTGETKTFRAGQRFTVDLGNQKAVQMTLGGQALSNLPTIKNSGVVVRNLVLTRDHVSLGGQEVTISSASRPAPSTTVVSNPVPAVASTPPTSAKTPAPHTVKSSGPASAHPKTTLKPGNSKPKNIGTRLTPKPFKRTPVKSSTITPVDPIPARP